MDWGFKAWTSSHERHQSGSWFPGAACELNPLFPGATCEAVEAPTIHGKISEEVTYSLHFLRKGFCFSMELMTPWMALVCNAASLLLPPLVPTACRLSSDGLGLPRASATVSL